MKTFAFATAIALIASPGLADMQTAIERYNASVDSPNQRIVLTDRRVANGTFSTRAAPMTQANAIARANVSAEGNDRIILPDGQPSAQGFSTQGSMSEAARRAVALANRSAEGTDRIVLR